MSRRQFGNNVLVEEISRFQGPIPGNEAKGEFCGLRPQIVAHFKTRAAHPALAIVDRHAEPLRDLAVGESADMMKEKDVLLLCGQGMQRTLNGHAIERRGIGTTRDLVDEREWLGLQKAVNRHLYAPEFTQMHQHTVGSDTIKPGAKLRMPAESGQAQVKAQGRLPA